MCYNTPTSDEARPETGSVTKINIYHILGGIYL